MTKYVFAGTVTVSVYTEVEADSYEEALEEVESRHTEIGRPDPHTEEEAWTTDELDGEVFDIRLDGVEDSESE